MTAPEVVAQAPVSPPLPAGPEARPRRRLAYRTFGIAVEPATARTRWLILLALAVFVVFAVWAIAFVPPNMDEFNHPHRLACSYPNAHLNAGPSFVIGCDSYRIDYGAFAYHRGFQYIGATSSLLYYPVWSLWRSPYSYLLMGLGFLLAFAWLTTRALKLSPRHTVLVLCYFPIAYSFIHDTGPLRLSLLSFPLLVLLIGKMLDARRIAAKLGFAAAGAALVTLCVEDKPFYTFVFANLALFVFASLAHTRSMRGLASDALRNRLPILTFTLLSLAGVGALLFLGTTEGQTYFSYLRNLPQDVFRPLVQATLILAYSLSSPRYAHRVFEIPLPLQLAAAAVGAVLLAWLLLVAWRSRTPGRTVLLAFCLSYFGGAAVFMATRTPWAGHHYVFLHLPILAVVLLVAAGSPRRFRFALGGTLLLTMMSMGVLALSEIDPKSANERARVFNFLSRPDVASGNVINFSSFGGYYHQALFGHDSQLVTWSHSGRRNQDPAIELHRLARLTSRNIVNICRDCDLGLMRDFFATDRIREVELGLTHWKVFQIETD